MKYGVISDSHDNFYNLEQAIKLLLDRGIRNCFHLGDFCSPAIVREMAAQSEIKWVCVWGNVDGAKARILLDQKSNPNFDISDESFREFEVEGGKIFLTHFPIIARLAAESGEYKAAFYGHSHAQKSEKLKNGTLLANPGEIAGFVEGKPGFGIYDSERNEIEMVRLKDFRVAKS